MSNSIFDADLLQSLPAVLLNDDTVAALAGVTAEELHVLLNQIPSVIIYPLIDQLPEDVLDVLAKDFKIDWYDYDYSLEEKRETVKTAWSVHRKLGTKYAVETAISSIYKETKVAEWWEYDGLPYHFKLLLDVTYENVDPAKHRRVLERVAYYKNLRSVLDGVEYSVNAEGTAEFRAGIAAAGYSIQIPVLLQPYGMKLDHIVARSDAARTHVAVGMEYVKMTIKTEVKANALE